MSKPQNIQFLMMSCKENQLLHILHAAWKIYEQFQLPNCMIS